MSVWRLDFIRVLEESGVEIGKAMVEGYVVLDDVGQARVPQPWWKR